MMRSAAEWLVRQEKSFLSEPITYHHYGDMPVTINIPAVRGRTIFRVDEDYGITTRIVSVDFIVDINDMDFEPTKGDEIHCDGICFEVLAPNNEPVWRWSGANGEALRIHSKEVGKANG